MSEKEEDEQGSRHLIHFPVFGFHYWSFHKPKVIGSHGDTKQDVETMDVDRIEKSTRVNTEQEQHSGIVRAPFEAPETTQNAPGLSSCNTRDVNEIVKMDVDSVESESIPRTKPSSISSLPTSETRDLPTALAATNPSPETHAASAACSTPADTVSDKDKARMEEDPAHKLDLLKRMRHFVVTLISSILNARPAIPSNVNASPQPEPEPSRAVPNDGSYIFLNGPSDSVLPPIIVQFRQELKTKKPSIRGIFAMDRISFAESDMAKYRNGYPGEEVLD